MHRQKMGPGTSQKYYKNHQYSGSRKRRKRVQGQMKHHGEVKSRNELCKRPKLDDDGKKDDSQANISSSFMKNKKLDSNENQENVVQCRASQNLENVQLDQNQFLTKQLCLYDESHECITPKVILHRTTDIPGDGNCLFHSLIHVLQLQISTCDLRRQLRDSPYLNSCHNPQEAHNILSSNNEYGDLDCLYLFAKIYNQNICVHYHYFNVISNNEDTRFCHFKANDTYKWIHLDLRELHFTPYFSDDEKKKEDERKQKQKSKEYSKQYQDKKRASNFQTGPSKTFNLPNDMENNQYKSMGSMPQIIMKSDYVSTNFQCQSEKRKHSTDVKEEQHNSNSMNIIQQRHTLIIKKYDKESILAKEDTEDSGSGHGVDTFGTQPEQKVNAVDIEHNMLLVQDDQDITASEDTKIFIQQWNSDVLNIVCRICLAVNTKMYNIGDYKLKQSYLDLTGLLFSKEDMLPNMLCWECVTRLQNANSFREKALRSYNLLLNTVKTKTSLSISDVQSIDRVENGLQTSLAVTYISDSAHAAHVDAINEVKQEVLDELEVPDQQEEPDEQEIQDQQEVQDEQEVGNEPELDTEVVELSERDPLNIGTR